MYSEIPQGSKINIQGLKACNKCRKEKPTSEFYIRKDRRLPYYSAVCKTCCYIRHIEWKKRTGWNKKVWRERKEYKKKYRGNNLRYEYGKIYQEKNKEKILQRNREYRNKVKDTPQFKIRKSISNRLRKALISGKGDNKTMQLLGCSIVDFKLYLEAQFLDGMNWGNYGLNGWHIDHKKPISLFDLSDNAQLKEAFHYTNMQPLWAFDNMSKGNKRIDV